MFRIIVLCFMGLGISAYSTTGHTKSDHIRDPLVYKGSKYDHPADLLFKNIDTLNDFTNHPTYLALNNEQQFSAKHYLTSMNYCETGKWEIDKGLKKSSKSCQKVMSIYKELYMRGYSWGYSSGDLSIDPVFLNMPKIAKNCENKRRNLGATLQPSAKIQPFCNRDGGVTNINGGLTNVIAINFIAKDTISSPHKASTAKTNTSKTSSSVSGVKTIIIEPSKNNKKNRGSWLQVSEVVAIETGSEKDLAHRANKATTESSSSYSKKSHSNNVISGVGPDRYPNIFHSNGRDKVPFLKVILNQSSQLDSITLFGRDDGNSGRDIYDLTLRDEHGKTILKRMNLNATDSSHAVKIDFTENNQATGAVLAEPIKSQKAQSQRSKAEIARNTQSRNPNASTASKVKRFQEYSQLFSQANKAKVNKDFDSAKKLYNKVLNESKFDPVLTERELSIQIMTAKRELQAIAKSENRIKRNSSRQKPQKETSQQLVTALNALATGDLGLAEKTYKDLLQHPDGSIVLLANQGLERISSMRERKKIIGDAAKNPEIDDLYLSIASTLPEIERLPVLYMNELRKLGIGQYNNQKVARNVLDKHGFPMNTPLSFEKIKFRKKELARLINELNEKAKQFARSAPDDPSSYAKLLPPHQQKQLSEQVLYPAIMNIQTKTIDLLSRIPRTVKGLNEAYEINKWLFLVEYDYESNWNKLIRNKTNLTTCYRVSTDQQVELGPKTGRCLFDNTYSSRFLRNVWRIQYMREIDGVISQRIEKDGAELHVNAFLLAYGVDRRNFDLRDFAKAKYSPTKSDQKCLFDSCSSKLTAILKAEYNGKPLTAERKKHYLSTLENKSKALQERWNASAGQSKSQRYAIQTDIVSYARDVAKGIIEKLSNSAVKELTFVQKDDYKGFKKWNVETARRIRLQAVIWHELWDIGFGLGKKENALSALGLSGFTDGYVRATHYGGSPFVGIAEVLYDAQYKWLVNAAKATSADISAEFPSSWSSTGSYRTPQPPKRHYAVLMTPAELFFESIGQSVQQGASALASHGSHISQLQNRVIKTRKEFFRCYPSCKEIKNKRAQYSKALMEKDIYFLEISGQSQSLVHQGQRNMATVIEGLSGSTGSTLIDGGIPEVCQGYFSNWAAKVGQLNQTTNSDINDLFKGLDGMLKGDISGYKEQGFNLIQKQREAYAQSATEYKKYQVCRDQYEFDQYEI